MMRSRRSLLPRQVQTSFRKSEDDGTASIIGGDVDEEDD